jgi:hypothetical protein
MRMERSLKQAAENEATFRSVNERLEAKAAELELLDQRTPYLCECEDESCTEVLLLRRDEYESVRAHPRRFVLSPGHQGEDDETVRDEAEFTVIEKHGKEGALVEQKDPRTAG